MLLFLISTNLTPMISFETKKKSGVRNNKYKKIFTASNYEYTLPLPQYNILNQIEFENFKHDIKIPMAFSKKRLFIKISRKEKITKFFSKLGRNGYIYSTDFKSFFIISRSVSKHIQFIKMPKKCVVDGENVFFIFEKQLMTFRKYQMPKVWDVENLVDIAFSPEGDTFFLFENKISIYRDEELEKEIPFFGKPNLIIYLGFNELIVATKSCVFLVNIIDETAKKLIFIEADGIDDVKLYHRNIYILVGKRLIQYDIDNRKRTMILIGTSSRLAFGNNFVVAYDYCGRFIFCEAGNISNRKLINYSLNIKIIGYFINQDNHYFVQPKSIIMWKQSQEIDTIIPLKKKEEKKKEKKHAAHKEIMAEHFTDFKITKKETKEWKKFYNEFIKKEINLPPYESNGVFEKIKDSLEKFYSKDITIKDNKKKIEYVEKPKKRGF